MPHTTFGKSARARRGQSALLERIPKRVSRRPSATCAGPSDTADPGGRWNVWQVTQSLETLRPLPWHWRHVSMPGTPTSEDRVLTSTDAWHDTHSDPVPPPRNAMAVWRPWSKRARGYHRSGMREGA